MKALKTAGENWQLGKIGGVTDPAHKLQVAMGSFALSQVPALGTGAVLNACMSAFVNVAVAQGISADLIQRTLHEMADEMPQAIEAARLTNAAAANSEETPS